MERSATYHIELVGSGGESVDLMRTFMSHGVASLPPMHLDERAGRLDVTLSLNKGQVRTVTLARGRQGYVDVRVAGRLPGARTRADVIGAVRHLLRLDEDLSVFYAQVRSDPELSWAASGAGRMIRSHSVFEEIIKTIATTNCAWSATERMVAALVANLGRAAAGAPQAGPRGRAFPSAEAMASAPESFYRDVVRAGYRGRYMRALASGVVAGHIEVESLGPVGRGDIPDEEAEARLLALPGIGPYAAAHVMMMLGRYSSLILDSWTRPTYVRLAGHKRPVKDSTIRKRFMRYGPYAGLAFWLYLTRGWIDPAAAPPKEV